MSKPRKAPEITEQMRKEALHCAAQHVSCYVEDEKYEKIAGTTAACQTCSRLDVCSLDRIFYLGYVFSEETSTPISFLVRRHDNDMGSST